ncbi:MULTISPECIES: polysaccharide deacetylase family protein [Clostridium]|uniref:Polysaccharide deacetylase family protein n=1 Tax=Clostridium aquiflavi TaxID=3073603 RepID=A0ABU1ECD0_9CLOT|nr:MULTISPECIES: polysaccharide deacetylase family protein [unclassified Clostridium]MDR5585929.1 polysaccharide deacetylase family protein [Clostridium sp. 5N-1]NFG60929.1 polysaccharide deacetylase [Clostridium botulinum]NFQ09486.1 polysaccharide deacetylase [Clostridium botulinum]
MKNKWKYFLLIAINILLIISIFEQNFRSISTGANIDSTNVNSNEETNNYKKKIIYLTFDDGPSYKVTERVLNVLKEKDVKATFFLIGNQIEGKEDIVKRINDEGHGIGLHTYSHKYKCIYCNEDNFIKEMIECRNEINKVVGVSPNIIRFPGGSYKHLSKSYLKKLHDNNFKIYDWNLDTEDGLNPKLPPCKLYRKAINESENLSTIILLMHCTDLQKNTCTALPEIIDYYKSKGYEFRTIEEDTPEIYFKIRKNN